MKLTERSCLISKAALVATVLLLPCFFIDRTGGQEEGLKIRLSEGARRVQPGDRPGGDSRPAEVLPGVDVARLLRRAPEIKREAGASFSLRDRSLPPPRTGLTIEAPLPVPDDEVPPVVAREPLRIERYAPEGAVTMAPFLSVTFSQPMIELTGTGATRATPARLTPSPPGRWRWIGTRTLLFEPERRFPMATRYRVEIPSGTMSAVGNELVEAKSWEFVTPPPKLVTGLPNGQSVSRDPLLYLEFDQKVDPVTVVSRVRLLSGGMEQRSLRLATSEEVATDAEIAELTKKAQPGYWVALRVDRRGLPADLPAGTHFTVEIPPGMPSAEGPLTTTEAQLYSFKTHAPIEFAGLQCGWREKSELCDPGENWRLKFNNPISEDFDPKWIRFDPPLPDADISRLYDGFILIEPHARPRTRYTITISELVTDIHGQKLAQDVRASIETDGLSPQLLVPGGDGMIVLDPAGEKRISVYSINHEKFMARLYAVDPSDFGNYLVNLRSHYSRWREGKDAQAFPDIGRPVMDRIIEVDWRPDELAVTRIDLAPAFRGGPGHALLVIEPTINVTNSDGPPLIARWIQSTGIALDALADGDSLVVWANSLKDGSPLAGVSLDLIEEASAGRSVLGRPALTSSEGTARIELPASEVDKILIARSGEDSAILAQEVYQWGLWSNATKSSKRDDLRWHVIDDRSIYRPGEEAHFKGWVRRSDSSPLGDIGLARDLNRRIEYLLSDSQGNQLAAGSAGLTPLGGFDLAVKLPPNVNLGTATLKLTAGGDEARLSGLEHEHRFTIQEFRRPEFEVRVKAGEGPHFVGGHTEVEIEAGYFAGGALPRSDVRWTVNTELTNFTPPGRDDFTFGKWIPWWSSSSEYGDTEEFEGRTDSEGRHRLRIDFDSVDPPRPARVYALGMISDVNRQSLSGSAAFIVHPAELYVGLRSPRLFVERGKELVVESIVTDLDGKAVTGRRITMRAVRVDWKYVKGEWVEQETERQECAVVSAAEPVVCRFATTQGGRYRVTAEVLDDRERRNQSELTLWVSGGRARPERTLAQESVELIPDKKEHRSGETAEILVQAPFAPAEGMVTLVRGGIVSTGRFRVESDTYTLRIPIEEAYVPNLTVQVDLVGETWRTNDAGDPARDLPKRPAFASGRIELSIPPVKRRLSVTATPRRRELEPGGRTDVTIAVRDATGRPVRGGEVTLIVVDEAILSLTNYRLFDPVNVFYRDRDDRIFEFHSRNQVELAEPWELVGQNKAPGARGLDQLRRMRVGIGVAGGGMGVACMSASTVEYVVVAGGAGDGEIRTRLDFNPLAVFAATVVTDATGHATVPVRLPDNLTRYRVMAIAAAGENSFGIAESSITARLPLMVRPSAPRFLRYGDRFELPVVVQNQTGRPMTVDLAVRASNLEFLEARSSKGVSTAGRRVTVPANDRLEVRFPAGTVLPGLARFQSVASSGSYSDAAEISLPVRTPATTEAVAVYGEIDDGAIKQPVSAPKDAIREFGGLEITTSSTQLQSLTDAALYLRSYPFECAEQVSSRILANVALRDTLDAFAAKGLPGHEAVDRSVTADLGKLASMQNEDGGFGFWRSGESSWPYLSIHVAHALQRAKEKGFDVPSEMLDRSRGYLRKIDQRTPGNYTPGLRRSLKAYSLYVLKLMGEETAIDTLDEIDRAGGIDAFPLEALGWLLTALSGDDRGRARIDEILRILNARAVETAGAANFTTSYSEGAYLLLHSDRRTDAVLLSGLIEAEPGNSLIPKLARGLLAHRRNGRWSNTQENGFALLALDKYFQAYENQTPDFIARAWYGEALAGNHHFSGRRVDSQRISIPMGLLAEDSRDLVLSKDGRGRMYYRMGLEYAPSDLQIEAADAGFDVSRSYEAIDDPNDVRREEEGSWRIRAGARVRVRLTMAAASRRYHVALVDSLPAGFEALNPELATTENLPLEESWWRGWFDHQNMHDDRVEAFASLLPEGVYTYTYFARATTPGRFNVAPARAEEMYTPETFGRTGSTRVIIE